MKNNNIKTLMVVFTLVVFCGVNNAVGQSLQQIDQWSGQLQDANWRNRQSAAFNLIGLPSDLKTANVKDALIRELEREFDRINKGNFEKCPNCDDGGEMGYYTWLFDAVSNMKDDKAFPLFVRIGAPTALVKYGNKGIKEILAKLDSTSKCNEEFAFVKVLADILDPKISGFKPNGVIKNDIKQSLIKTLRKSKHPEPTVEWYEYRARECANVRKQVVRELGYLAEAGDTEVLPIIESIAKEDPYFTISKKTKKNGPYDVREEAQKILDMLSSRGLSK